MFSLLALIDIGPGADELQRIAGVVIDDLEGILDPDVVAASALETVLDLEMVLSSEFWRT